MSDIQTPGLIYYTQPNFCSPAVQTVINSVCECPGFIPGDCIRVHSSEYKVSGVVTENTIATQKTRAARVVIPTTNAESVAIALVDSRNKSVSNKSSTYSDQTMGLRQDYVECNVEGVGWTTVRSGYNVMGYGVYTYGSDGSSSNYSATITANDALVLFGRCGEIGQITYEYQTSSSVQGGVGIQTIPGYLSTYRTLLDPTWALGIRIMQGVGKEAAVRVWCGEEEGEYGIGPPTLESWKDIRRVFNGWPSETEHDKQTSPIGFA